MLHVFLLVYWLWHPINPDRTKPWNDLPLLPPARELYEDIQIFTQLGNAKAALGRLQGRSIAIPNQGAINQLKQSPGSQSI